MNIMIEGPPHVSIKEPMDMARKSCAMNMEIRRKETALPFVSLEWGQGRVRRVPESWNGIETVNDGDICTLMCKQICTTRDRLLIGGVCTM